MAARAWDEDGAETARYDVVVCGGGPAGIGAAVAAGRAGARTLLVEATGRLGGIWMNAFVSTFCDSPGGPVFDELAERLIALDAGYWREDPERFRPPGRFPFQLETASALACEMVSEAGVDLRFCTVAERAVVRDGRVCGVVLATKRGPVRVDASVVVDCTADADMAASAGARFEQGDPEDGRIQVCNFRWRMTGVDTEAFARAGISGEALEALFSEANRTGAIVPPDGIFGQDGDTFPYARATKSLKLGSWELRDIDPTDGAQVSRALSQCQRTALHIVRFCRSRLPGYERCRIDRLPATLGTRESRRVVGRYTLTRDDVLRGATFDDGVVRAWFWLDHHDPPPGRSIPYGLAYVKAHQPPPGEWYEIPYRSLLPCGLDGLLVAGRCISCDRGALSSLRIMPTCMFMGAAAGTAAAWSARAGIPPGALDPVPLKKAMLG